MKNLFLLIAAIFILSCSNKPNYEAIGQGLCTCMQPMLDLTNEITKVSEEADNEEKVKILLEELEQANLSTEACIDQIKTKFPDIDADDEQANAAFQKACPDIAKFLETE